MPVKSVSDGVKGEGEESPGLAAGGSARVPKWGFLVQKVAPAPCVHPALTAGCRGVLLIPKGGSLGTSEGMPAPRWHFCVLGSLAK